MFGLRRHRVGGRLGALAFFVFGLSSCAGDPSGTGVIAAILIALSPSSVTIQQGSNGSVTVTLTRSGGFAGAVTITAEGVPTGVTIPGLTIAAGQASGTLSLSTLASVVAATSPITIRATAAGVTSVTATLTLVIQALPTGGFSLSLAPAAVSVQQGAQGTSSLTVARTAPFTGAVALTATGAPTGMTITFNPASVTGTSSTLTIQAGAAVTAGAHTITVRGNATGIAEQTATLTVTVTAAAGGFTLSMSPTTLSVQQGANGTSTVTIARSGSFTGAVALAASGLPSGVTASFNPSSVTGTSSTLTLSASAGATVGAATVTVTGTGTGATNQTATVAVTVQASGGGGGGNVSVAFCAGSGIPVWVGFQDGPSGSWVRSTSATGTFSGSVNSGRGGFAYVTAETGGGYNTVVNYGTTAELQSYGTGLCSGSTGVGKTVNLTVVGAGLTDFVGAALGTSSAVVFAGAPGVFERVPDGTVDLIGARAAFNGASFTLNKLFAQRGINPAANSTVTMDFNGSNALDPVAGTATITGIGADQALLNMTYKSANQTFASVSFETAPSGATSRSFAGFPPVAGSFHFLTITAYPPGMTFDRTRTMGVVFGTVGNRTLALGPDLGAVTVSTAATTPTFRPQAVIPASAPYNMFWSFGASQGSGIGARSVTVQSSIGYVGGAPATVTLAVPDLSGGAGFDLNWGLSSSVSSNWFAHAQAYTGFGTQGQYTEGATVSSASRLGVIAAGFQQK